MMKPLKKREICCKIRMDKEVHPEDGKEGGGLILEVNEELIILRSPEEIHAEDLKKLADFRIIDDTFARSFSATPIRSAV